MKLHVTASLLALLVGSGCSPSGDNNGVGNGEGSGNGGSGSTSSVGPNRT